MDQIMITAAKKCIEENRLHALQSTYEEFIASFDTSQTDWPYIFQKIYLHSCLKGRKEIAEWLEKTIYPNMEPIQKIALRQIFPYGRHLLQKAIKTH